MNKLLASLMTGLFVACMSLGAMAAEPAKTDAAPTATEAAPAAGAAKEKPAAPAKKAHGKKSHKKAAKK